MTFGFADFLVMLGSSIALTGIFIVYPPAALILGGLGLAAVGYQASK